MKNKQAKNSNNIDGIVKNTPEEVQTTAESITEAKVESKNVTKLEKKEVKPKKNKKVGFLGSVINELKLVKWPTLKYVAGWSLTIIMFTTVIGSVMGFTDYYFESGIKFVDCTSPNGSKNQSVQDCVKDLTTSLTFQKYFNRNLAATPATTEPSTDLPVESSISPESEITPSIPVVEPTITSDPVPNEAEAGPTN